MPATRNIDRVLSCVALAVAAATATCAAAADPAARLYFIRGMDRSDGMSVRIDPGAGTLRVTSDQFDARKCVDTTAALCFESGYMDFASPPAAGAETWVAGGETFVAAGTCRARLGSERITALRIVSEQRYGRFEFYYDATGNRLLGWRLDYAGLDGRPAHDVWMLEGVRRCRPVASED
jgi:hypothetical protein